MTIKCFNYRNEFIEFNVDDRATFARVEVISGDEHIDVYTITDDDIICEVADIGGRALDYHDWEYIVDLRNEGEKNRWMNRANAEYFYSEFDPNF